MKYKNPIIPGFYPDPSICKVGEDYYIVNSTFEYFPGIPIHHSRDLINWTPIGHCITRNSQLKLRKGNPNSTGLYAPTIRYHEGIFYVVCTNIAYGDQDEGNFMVWTKDPRGEWSDPIWIDCPGIDPSLFFDDDGKVYYTGTNGAIFLCELDIESGEVVNEIYPIWAGTGGNDPEGPHLYKINGWYYLFISEGGTELCHMLTVARSQHIYGPYEPCPRNPVLSNRSYGLDIKAVGHADIFCDQNKHWWAVCLGIRPVSYPFRHNLGRETMLVPLSWDAQGWPLIGRDGQLDELIDSNQLPLNQEEPLIQNNTSGLTSDVFDEADLGYHWNFIYNPEEVFWQGTAEGLKLYGNEVGLSEAKSLAWLGRRQEHHKCIVRAFLSFQPSQEGEEAGLTIYMNHQHHYEIAVSYLLGKSYLILRRQIGSLVKIEQQVEFDDEAVELIIEADKESYRLKYRKQGDEICLGRGETAYLTTEVGGKFTGNYFAMYATGNGRKMVQPAIFTRFDYEVKKNK